MYINDKSNTSAAVVLNPKGVHVATIRVLYGSGGTVHAEIFNHGDAAIRACLDTAEKTGRVSAKDIAKADSIAPEYYVTPEARRGYVAHELFSIQRGRAGGGGYDKRAAALAGMLIDGHTLANHCGNVPEDESKRARLFAEYCRAHDSAEGEARYLDKYDNGNGYSYWSKRAARIGCSFSNWQGSDAEAIAQNVKRGMSEKEARAAINSYGGPRPYRGRSSSLYFMPGPGRLESLGYRVLEAI